MHYTAPSATTDISLEAFIERLQRHPDVEGVVLIGSAQKAHLQAASDYDLFVVLAKLPVPMRVGVTHIDQRLCDLLFATVEEIDAILAANQPLDGEAWTGRIVRWCKEGTILFDRSTRLDQVKQKVETGSWISPITDLARYQVWFGINYNLVQTRRVSRSSDPVYRLVVRMRLLYSLSEILGGYFTLRQLLWPGEKEAIHYLTAHDPHFLSLFTEAIQERNFERQLRLYEEVAALATTPYGGLWHKDVTVFQLDEAVSSSQEEAQRSLLWWRSLLGNEPEQL